MVESQEHQLHKLLLVETGGKWFHQMIAAQKQLQKNQCFNVVTLVTTLAQR